MNESLCHSREILDSLPVGILVLDQNGTVKAHNELALRMLEIDVIDLLSADIQSMPIHEALKEGIQAAMEGKAGRHRVTLRVGSKSLSCTLRGGARDENDESIDLILVLEDITKAIQLDGLKYDFIDTILHKIRNPLTTLETSMSIACSNRMGEISPQAKAILEMSYNEVRRLSHLTNDLRDLFIIESGLMDKELEIESFSATKIIEKIYSEFTKMPSPFRDLRERLRIEGDMQSFVWADFQKLKQIMQAIISNALIFSAPKSQIRLELRREDKRTALLIKDKGIGIPKERLPFVFTKFFRDDNEITRKVPGNGLGLYISKCLVGLLNGVIYCDSEPGKGSTFCIMLPAEKSDNSQS